MRYIGLIRDLLFMAKLRKKSVVLRRGCRVHYDCQVEGNNLISFGTKLFGCTLGKGTTISRNCRFDNCVIGKYCSIGEGVKVVVGQHPTSDFISTHPMFYTNRFANIGLSGPEKTEFEEHKYADAEKHYVIIGNDVWIASNALLMEGISVGNGAIIAAGAVVTKDVPPYSIVGGVPAKVLKYRFSEGEIQFLQKTEWYNKPLADIISHRAAFTSFQSFESIFDGQEVE